MTEKCNGVRAYHCPYGNFCKAETYNVLYKSGEVNVKKDITDFLNQFTNESPLWIRYTKIYVCKPQLDKEELNNLLNKLNNLEK
jgi:hypothetical protein